MNQFTIEDLIQFMYEETSTLKTIAISTELENNWELREKYEDLLADHKRLSSFELKSPHRNTIDAILNYAEKSVNEVPVEL